MGSNLAIPLRPSIVSSGETGMFFSRTRSASLDRLVLTLKIQIHAGASVDRALLLGLILVATGATAPVADAQKVQLSVDASAKIDRSIFGQLAEHLGHGVSLTAPKVDSVNTFDAPNAVVPKAVTAEVQGGKLAPKLESKSVTVIAIEQ
jgi:hypothetical protein